MGKKTVEVVISAQGICCAVAAILFAGATPTRLMREQPALWMIPVLLLVWAVFSLYKKKDWARKLSRNSEE